LVDLDGDRRLGITITPPLRMLWIFRDAPLRGRSL
jgi:hypothetical protein